MNVTQVKFEIQSVWQFHGKYNYLTIPTVETFLNSTRSDFKTRKSDRIFFSAELEDRISDSEVKIQPTSSA